MKKHLEYLIFPNLREIKRSIFFLISFLVVGTFGQVSLFEGVDEESWARCFHSSILELGNTDSLIQPKGLVADDENSMGLCSKRSFELVSLSVPDLLSLPIQNLNYEAFFNSVNSFRYNLIFGFSPLRSPPLFS